MTSSPEPTFGRVAIVGSGLVGGSFALALKAAGRVDRVAVFDREPGHAARALALGIADRASDSIGDTVRDADLVVVAVPVAQSGSVFAAMEPHLAPAAVVTDVGSTKRTVIAAARAALGDAIGRFVPGHPIAGREVHGPDAARADLFDGKRVLLTPLAENDERSVARVESAWRTCGARVERLDADTHDAVLSSVSHLPHLLAYALVGQIADAVDAERKFDLAGAGFRDFTRIAASSPELWRDVMLANRDALLVDLAAYRDRLDTLRDWIVGGDAEALRASFAKASAARVKWGEHR